jgi:transcriptional regulator with PAS, ATPase and Fis domain
MDKNEIIEMLKIISNGMDPSVEEQSTSQPTEYYHEIIRSLCIAVASLITDHPPDKLRSMKYVKEAFTKYQDNIEKEIVFSVVEGTNYDLQKAAEEMGTTYRDLNNKIRAFGIGTEIAINALLKNPATEYLVVARDLSLDKFLNKIEKEIIYSALEEANFKQNQAAELLNISFRSLRYRIDNLGIRKHIDSDRVKKKSSTDYFKYFKNLPLDQLLQQIEKKAILEALKEANNNKTAAADKLGISFRSLRYRIENHGITL